VGISLTRHRLRARVVDDMAVVEVLDWIMGILEVETTAGVIAALWGAAIDCLATRIQSPGQRDSRAHLHVPRRRARR
jgi:hypothetical protein